MQLRDDEIELNKQHKTKMFYLNLYIPECHYMWHLMHPDDNRFNNKNAACKKYYERHNIQTDTARKIFNIFSVASSSTNPQKLIYMIVKDIEVICMSWRLIMKYSQFEEIHRFEGIGRTTHQEYFEMCNMSIRTKLMRLFEVCGLDGIPKYWSK